MTDKSAQRIHVIVRGTAATLLCYEKTKAFGWRTCDPPGLITGFAGRNGVSAAKKEGDGCTPAGYFSLGCAFGVRKKPVTKMVYRQITADSCWVDDPGSRHYNTWVEDCDAADWKSAEHLYNYPVEYAYGVVIEYNTAERVPGGGSAIFLHCGSRATSGCVAVPEAALLSILRWLDPKKKPGILITEA